MEAVQSTYPPDSTPAKRQLFCRANATHFSTVIPLLLSSSVESAVRTWLPEVSWKQPWFTKFPTSGTTVGVGEPVVVEGFETGGEGALLEPDVAKLVVVAGFENGGEGALLELEVGNSVLFGCETGEGALVVGGCETGGTVLVFETEGIVLVCGGCGIIDVLGGLPPPAQVVAPVVHVWSGWQTLQRAPISHGTELLSQHTASAS
jgi:hypothetical protein